MFDIIGPIMIGPSSSHTAGAVRIGKVARRLLGEDPERAVIKLHGSFARTYKGHGTDKAIVAGLLGFNTDDVRIRDSLEIAKELGLDVTFQKVFIKDAHPNTVLIEVVGKSGGSISVVGASVGGGKIIVKRINDLDVEFTGEYFSVIISHTDKPGAVALVTSILADSKINISQMEVFRSNRGGSAAMVIETDDPVVEELTDKIKSIYGIKSVTTIEPI